MTKTTLYLDDASLRALKELASRTGRKTITSCVREAIHEYLGRRRSRKNGAQVAEKLRGIVPRGTFGDPLEYQRRLRDEWA